MGCRYSDKSLFLFLSSFFFKKKKKKSHPTVLLLAHIFKGETEELAEKLLELELEIDEAERALSPHEFEEDLGVDGNGLNDNSDTGNSDAPPPSFCDETSGSIPWHDALSVSIRPGDALYLPVRAHRERAGTRKPVLWNSCLVYAMSGGMVSSRRKRHRRLPRQETLSLGPVVLVSSSRLFDILVLFPL